MSLIERSITYRLRGKSSIAQISVAWAKYRIRFSTGLEIDPDGWDGRRALPKSAHGRMRRSATYINARLSEMENSVESLFMRAEMTDKVPTPVEVEAALKGKEVEPQMKALYLKFTCDGERSRMWALNTIKSVKNIGELLWAWKPDLRPSDLQGDGLRRFADWATRHSLNGKNKGLSNSTIAKSCRVVQWFLKWLEKNGYLQEGISSSVEKPRLRTVDNPVIYLTEEELDRVARLKFTPIPHCTDFADQAEIARDLFLFCCYTGMRYSDTQTLRPGNIRDGCINLVMRKTAKPVRIELNDVSAAILEKYKGRWPDRALPSMHLSAMNRWMKKFGEMAGIDTPIVISRYQGSRREDVTVKKYELLSSHTGRKTFICQALSLGISPMVVMKWTGHSSYSAMKPYIDILDTEKVRAMNLFNVRRPLPGADDADGKGR